MSARRRKVTVGVLGVGSAVVLLPWVVAAGGAKGPCEDASCYYMGSYGEIDVCACDEGPSPRVCPEGCPDSRRAKGLPPYWIRFKHPDGANDSKKVVACLDVVKAEYGGETYGLIQIMEKEPPQNAEIKEVDAKKALKLKSFNPKNKFRHEVQVQLTLHDKFDPSQKNEKVEFTAILKPPSQE